MSNVEYQVPEEEIAKVGNCPGRDRAGKGERRRGVDGIAPVDFRDPELFVREEKDLEDR